MEIAKQILHEKQLQIFKSQDPEEEFFDVVFEIDGKKIYADKFRLAANSTTFRSMLSQRWNSKNELIEIEGNTFEDFKEFLTFIYSGECNLTNKNIFNMVDIAEFYNVDVLKNICDEYAVKMEITNDNIFSMLEFANKYSMKKLMQILCVYFPKKFGLLTASDKFLSLDESIVMEMIAVVEKKIEPEEIFDAVYKWAEHQAELKKIASNVPNFNMNDAIKKELSYLLPHIQFRQMKLEYLHKFVVLKAFIFPSLQELSDILSFVTSKDYIRAKVTVKAIGPNGEILHGLLNHNDAAIEIIKSLNNSSSTKGFIRSFYWTTNSKIPSTPSQLKKRDGVEWYLAYVSGRHFGILDGSQIYDCDYLIAEMFSEEKIETSNGWKIEIV